MNTFQPLVPTDRGLKIKPANTAVPLVPKPGRASYFSSFMYAVILLLFTAFSVPVQAQTSSMPPVNAGSSRPQRPNFVKFNLVSPFLNSVTIAYERKTDTCTSLMFGASYINCTYNNIQYSGLALTPEYRFYMSSTESPAGFFVAPFVRYMYLSTRSENTSYDITGQGTTSLVTGKNHNLGAGFILGKQWVFNDLVGIELFAGPVYNWNAYSEITPTGAIRGYSCRFGANIGFGWR